MSMTLKGADKLAAQLKALGNADYIPAMAKGTEVIFDEMKSRTPVDEGELLDSERMIVEKDSVVLYAGTDHAVHVEFGTSKMPPQSYMRAAIDDKSDEAMKITADEVEAIMKRTV